jgi:cytidyltransferase-like protein
MVLDLVDEVSMKAMQLYCQDARKLTVDGIVGKIGIASGCYDLFHAYHVIYFERCKRFLGPNGVLIVGVDSDLLVKKVKGETRPIFNEVTRLKMVSTCMYVDAAFIMNSVKDHERLVDYLTPDYVFKNQIYREMDVNNYAQAAPTDVYVGNGKLVIVADIEEIQSTTDFIEKIKGL